jgi:hypothetical protein
MPELSQILTSVLNGAIKAVEDSEREHLINQVNTVQALDGKQAGAAELLDLYEKGYLPDYFAGMELTVSAQLSMTTGRDTQIGVSAGGNVAGIALQGSLTETFRQATQTNLSVTVNLARQSRNRGIEHTLNSLQSLPTPALPAPQTPPK